MSRSCLRKWPGVCEAGCDSSGAGYPEPEIRGAERLARGNQHTW